MVHAIVEVASKVHRSLIHDNSDAAAEKQHEGDYLHHTSR